jgi:hypothetical protein
MCLLLSHPPAVGFFSTLNWKKAATDSPGAESDKLKKSPSNIILAELHFADRAAGNFPFIFFVTFNF